MSGGSSEDATQSPLRSDSSASPALSLDTFKGIEYPQLPEIKTYMQVFGH